MTGAVNVMRIPAVEASRIINIGVVFNQVAK